MHSTDRQAQERPPLLAERAAKTSRKAQARLENPLGIVADRCVEASADPRDAQPRAALSSLASSYWLSELAKGAQESGLQHACACSAGSVSPTFGTANNE